MTAKTAMDLDALDSRNRLVATVALALLEGGRVTFTHANNALRDADFFGRMPGFLSIVGGRMPGFLSIVGGRMPGFHWENAGFLCALCSIMH